MDKHSITLVIDKEMYSRICDHLDLEIDKIVYKLYDLTPEEIDIVEGGNHA